MIKSIGVLGAGQMGSGIAYTFARYGFPVTLVDVQESSLEKAKSYVEKTFTREAEKGSLPKDHPLLPILTYETNFQAFEGCDLVIEAITEDLNLKTTALKQISSLISESSFIASNTSSIPISTLASVTQNPDKFIGMHFMNPVPVMKLVEIIRGAQTSDETFKAIFNLTLTLQKVPVISTDVPGFIINRILMPMLNEAIEALDQGVATAEDIDKGMTIGLNHPMGPLTLADFIGLDTCKAILEVLYNGLGDSKYKPNKLLLDKVSKGHLGRKSGQGFYTYG